MSIGSEIVPGARVWKWAICRAAIFAGAVTVAGAAVWVLALATPSAFAQTQHAGAANAAGAEGHVPLISADEQTVDSPKVLILSSFERSTSSTRGQEDGIREVLERALPMVRLRTDYLMMADLPKEKLTPALHDNLADTVRLKYASERWDIVVTIDTLAYEVVTMHCPELAARQPVIFSGLTWDRPRVDALGIETTGVFERVAAADTISLIRRLMPAKNKIFVICSDSCFGERVREEAHSQIERAASAMQVRWSSSSQSADLANELKSIASDEVVLLLSLADSNAPIQDQSGLAIATAAPTFVLYQSMMGIDAIGGVVIDARKAGRAVGEMCVRVLSGQRVSEIPMSDRAAVQTAINLQAAKKWGISSSMIPSNAEIVNRPRAWHEAYRPYLGWVIAFLLVESGIVLALVAQSVGRRRAMKSLRESQNKYETAVRNSSEGIWDWDVKADEMTWSGSLRETLGIGDGLPTSRVGPSREWERRVHPDDMQSVQSAIKAHLQRGESYDIEYRLRVKDGSYRWFKSRGKAERNERGEPVRMIGSLTDVHERVTAGEKLKESEAKFRALFERGLDPICLFDERGNVIDANPAAVLRIGMDVESMRRENLLDWLCGGDGEDIPGPREAFAAYLSGASRGVFSVRKPTDAAEAEFEFSASPIGGGQHVVILRDVTERIRWERELAAREERYRLATENGSIAVWEVNTSDGKITTDPLLVQLLTGDPTVSLGENFERWQERLDPKDVELAKRNFARCASGEIDRYEHTVRVVLNDGRVRWLLSRAGSKRDQNGNVERIFGSAQDITAQYEAMESLRVAQERLAAITDNVPGLVYRSVQGVDNQHFVEYVSRGAKEVIGVDASEMIGACLWPADLIEPADAEKLADARASLSLPTGRREVAFRLRHPNGAIRWVRDIARYRHQDDGTIVWDGVIFDQTEVREAAEQLRVSERRYRNIVETAEEGIWLSGTDWTTTFVNSRMASMLGWVPSQMIGRHITEFMDDEGKALAREAMHRCQQGLSEQLEFKFLRRDGGHVWTLVSTKAVIGESGEFLGALAMITDISQRRKAQEALLRERRLFLGGPAVAWRWRNEEGWPVEYVSANVSSLGYDAAEFMDGRVKFADIVHPNDLERVGREVMQHVQAHAHDFEQEYRVRTRDGRWRWISDHTVIEYLPDGSVRGFAGYTLDTTERKLNEERLRQSEEHLRLLIQSTPVGVISWTTDFKVTAWNPAAERIFGYSADQAIGQDGRFIVPESVKPYVDQIWQKLVQARGGLRGSNENVRKDGKTIFCEWYNTPLVDSKNRVIGVASIVEDITDRSNFEKRQKRVMMELDHRVKNNLAVVLSLAERTGLTTSTFPDFLSAFTARIDAMMRTHNDLAATKWQGIGLKDLVARSIASFQAASDGEGRLMLEGGDFQLGARSSQTLAMIFHELVTNAAKYGALSGPLGSVHVCWEVLAPDQLEPERLRIVWQEQGGPPVKPPTRTGLGTSLIETMARHELKAEVGLMFLEAGVRCEITIPVTLATMSGDPVAKPDDFSEIGDTSGGKTSDTR